MPFVDDERKFWEEILKKPTSSEVAKELIVDPIHVSKENSKPFLTDEQANNNIIASNEENKDELNLECSICLKVLDEDSTELECLHAAHTNCILL